MFKFKNIMIVVLTLFLLSMIPTNINAASLSNVIYENGEITVKGKSPNTTQVQIAIFKTDKSPIYFATLDVKNGIFNSKLPATFDFDEGEYIIRVADYDGTNISNKTFNVELSGEIDDTPKTGNVDKTVITVGIITIIIAGIIVLKRNKV